MALKANWVDGEDFAATDANAVAAAVNILSSAAEAFVATTEFTASTSYTDLTTTTDTVTVTIGPSGKAVVSIGAVLSSNTAASFAFMSFALSGANTVAATDDRKIAYQSPAANSIAEFGRSFLLTGLTPGSTTFKAKYRAPANAATYSNRRITVEPL